MASPFRYHKEAKIEFFEAVKWYEEKSLDKVIYKQRPKTIHVIAIFHNKRNDTWTKRVL